MKGLDLDEKKLKMMWDLIVEYEKSEGFDKTKTAAVNHIVADIDEVFDQCY